MEWISIDLSLNYPISILPVGKENTILKLIGKLFFQLSVQVCSLLSQSEGERDAFFGGCGKEDYIVRLPPRALGCNLK